MTESAEQSSLANNPGVLIVDDEELMLEVTSIMIEDHGGKVFTAVDGQDGVEVFQKNQDNISLVVMDFSMPRMDGYQAAVEMKKINPKIGILMISGLQITPEVQEMVDNGEVLFLSKPFHEGDLISALTDLQANENS